MHNLKRALILCAVVALFAGCPRRPVVAPTPPEPIVPEETVTVAPEEPVEKPALVLNRIFFDFDKSDIRPDAATVLNQNAEMLKLYPEVRVVIEGHCCDIGTTEYNLALGERRAKAAKEYLRKLGITADRLSTVSYGEERPLDPANRERNRRSDFLVK